MFAQTYQNDWIDFTKDYIKISDARTGVYQLTYDELADVGFAVDADPRTFEMIWRGQPMNIKVVGEDDGSFDRTDYILFYGQKLDGFRDSVMYRDGVDVTNPYYNLFSDTSSYFLTSGVNNPARITQDSEQSNTYRDYIEKEKVVFYNANYSLGLEPSSYFFRSEYDDGEGWQSGATRTNSLTSWLGQDLAGIVDVSGYDYQAEVRFVGRNNNVHNIEVNLGGVNTKKYFIPSFTAKTNYTETVSWDYNMLEGSTLNIESYPRGDGSSIDYVAVAYEKYRYPISSDLQTEDYFHFNSYTDATVSALITETGIGEFWDISNPNEIRELFTTDSLGNTKVILPAQSGSESEYLYFKESSYLTSSEITPVVFEDLSAISSPDYLVIAHSSIWSQALQFETYRESAQGGGYDVLVVDQDDLFDQFNFGERSPYATRQFVEWMLNRHNPEYLLLFGNGATTNLKVSGSDFLRKTPVDVDNAYGVTDIVMTYGSPGSDIMFSNRIGDDDLTPRLATGRVPCYNAEEAQVFVDKLIEYEASYTSTIDRKRILHLAGGTTETEVVTFRNLLTSMENIISDKYYGGEVTMYSKETDEAVEFFNISKEVNEGLGMITFFGHSAPNFSDIDVGLVSQEVNGYENKGKYPILWINGCQSTDIYNSYFRIRTRDWMFTPDKGSIGALGHASYGHTFTLNEYSGLFYKYAFQDSVFSHKTIGEIQQRVITDFMAGRENSLFYQTHAVQFNYLGDPALKMLPQAHADYQVKTGSVSIKDVNGDEVLGDADSLVLNLEIENLGRTSEDSIEICVTRVSPNDTIVYASQKIPAIYHSQSVSTILNNPGFDGEGENNFVIELNCSQSVSEESFDNNSISYTNLLSNKSISLLYPYEFSILSDVEIQFAIENRLGDLSEQLQFELSLSPEFEQLVASSVLPADILIYNSVQLEVIGDTVTYYWRVKEQSQEDDQWQSSSFTYISGNEVVGWGQMELEQYYDNELLNIDRNLNNDLWEYASVSSEIVVNAAGISVLDYKALSTLAVNGQSIVVGAGRGGCTSSGVWVLAFDNETALPYHPDGLAYGSCGQIPRIAMSYNRLDLDSRQQSLVDFLDRIPQKDGIVFVTAGNHSGTLWGDDLKNRLKEFGVQLVDSISSNTTPYVFVGKRGASQPVFEQLAEVDSTVVSANIELIGNKEFGTITSPMIGPAKSWGIYNHKLSTDDKDSVQISLYAVDDDGNALMVHSFKNQDYVSIDIENDLGVSAEDYPYMYLEAYLKDSVNRDAGQLNNWSIQYEKYPEGVLIIDSLPESEVYVGRAIEYNYDFVNVTPYDFSDSIRVDYQFNLEGGISQSYYDEFESLNAYDTIQSTYKVVTDTLSGDIEFSLYVNNQYQSEYTYLNNFVLDGFRVVVDSAPPAMDVTFDGLRISNGDVVSPSPLIEVNVLDDNVYTNKSDTLGFYVYLKSNCDTCSYERIYFSDERLNITSDEDADEASFSLKLNTLENGQYVLKVVSEDFSGNVSSEIPTEIMFEVVNEQTITNIAFAPNPVSESSRLSFSITGESLPNDIDILIYSSQGELVKTITMDEIGEIHIGDNLTEYEWDGSGDNGLPLSNGLYIYEVKYDLDGTGLEYTTSEDEFKKQGRGKITILK